MEQSSLCVLPRVSVALISDTHGDVHPGIIALANTCDIIVHAGDVGGASVVEALRPRLGVVVAVCGNNDVPEKWPPAEHGFLGQLDETAAIGLPGGLLLVTHGHRHNPARQRHRKLRAAFPHARGIVYGHSHRCVIDDACLPWVLNPGAAGKARTYGGASMLLLQACPEEWRVQLHRVGPEPCYPC